MKQTASKSVSSYLRPIVDGLSIPVVSVFCDQALYKHWLVPKLPSMQSVPIYIWLLLYFPVLLIVFRAGSRCKTPVEFIICLFIASIVLHIYGYIALSTHQPGHMKIGEDQLDYWSYHLIFRMLFLGLLLFIAKVTNQIRKRQIDVSTSETTCTGQLD